MEEVIKKLISEYGWAAISVFVLLLIKNSLGNFVSGLMFMLGNDFSRDDIVYIEGKKARIVRQTPFKTIFYLEGTNRKMIVSNRRLYYLLIEKEMPKNGNDKNELKELDKRTDYDKR